MTRGRARRYVLTKQGYYPGVVASMGYDVWDWSTLNAGTLFQDSAKTTPASANGDVVGCWTDGVGGVDATQVTTANKPGLATASLGTLPTLSFDGGDLLATRNISISTFAVWVVYYSTDTAQSVIAEHGFNSFNSDGFNVFKRFLSPNAYVETNVNKSAVVSRKRFSTAIDANYYLYRTEYNGTHALHTMYKNNTTETLNDDGINGNPGTGAVNLPLHIGARFGVIVPTTGNIAHLCIVSPYPTPAIIAQMETYINGIWGVY